MRAIRLSVLTLATLIVAGPVLAQDSNITLPVAELERMLANDPMRIVSADKSRPKAPGDITSKADVSFGGREPFRVKLRRSEPGAGGRTERRSGTASARSWRTTCVRRGKRDAKLVPTTC